MVNQVPHVSICLNSMRSFLDLRLFPRWIVQMLNPKWPKADYNEFTKISSSIFRNFAPQAAQPSSYSNWCNSPSPAHFIGNIDTSSSILGLLLEVTSFFTISVSNWKRAYSYFNFTFNFQLKIKNKKSSQLNGSLLVVRYDQFVIMDRSTHYYFKNDITEHKKDWIAKKNEHVFQQWHFKTSF